MFYILSSMYSVLLLLTPMINSQSGNWFPSKTMSPAVFHWDWFFEWWHWMRSGISVLMVICQILVWLWLVGNWNLFIRAVRPFIIVSSLAIIIRISLFWSMAGCGLVSARTAIVIYSGAWAASSGLSHCCSFSTGRTPRGRWRRRMCRCPLLAVFSFPSACS